jgi:hypothetical protein
MKKPRALHIAAALSAALIAGVLGLPRAGQAETPLATSPQPALAVPPNAGAANAAAAAQAEENKAILALAVEVAKQQSEIIANQQTIDAKLAAIAENLRVARIYASRGGGGGGASPR